MKSPTSLLGFMHERKEWRVFLTQLADVKHPRDLRTLWGSLDILWRDTFLHLDRVAAVYVAFQGSGTVIDEWGPIDDERLLELILPYVPREADRRVFLAICKQLAWEWSQQSPSTTGG